MLKFYTKLWRAQHKREKWLCPLLSFQPHTTGTWQPHNCRFCTCICNSISLSATRTSPIILNYLLVAEQAQTESTGTGGKIRISNIQILITNRARRWHRRRWSRGIIPGTPRWRPAGLWWETVEFCKLWQGIWAGYIIRSPSPATTTTKRPVCQVCGLNFILWFENPVLNGEGRFIIFRW